MLLKKAPEDLTQRLVCYGTVLLCLLYMIKFLKRYSSKKPSTQQELRPIIRQSCLRIDPAQPHAAPKPRQQRHKRQQRILPEQWRPRDYISNHNFEESDVD